MYHTSTWLFLHCIGNNSLALISELSLSTYPIVGSIHLSYMYNLLSWSAKLPRSAHPRYIFPINSSRRKLLLSSLCSSNVYVVYVVYCPFELTLLKLTPVMAPHIVRWGIMGMKPWSWEKNRKKKKANWVIATGWIAESKISSLQYPV